MVLSYLVSTAGHAQEQNDANPHDVRSILQLVHEGAEEFRAEKVVGFTSMEAGGKWSCTTYSFPELLAHSGLLAQALIQDGLEPSRAGGAVVSMLCPTGFDFLISWLALMRMGYGVVLIAPQCSPSAIHHLLSSSSSLRLLYHPKYAQLAHEALALSPGTPSTALSPIASAKVSTLPALGLQSFDVDPDPASISHVFHSSGTSGTPKPIPHTHTHSVSVLPRRALPSYLRPASSSAAPAQPLTLPPGEPAAYTTTPLFHGGVSDLLRAWMARSMIYFYPTSDVPITMINVVASVEACDALEKPDRLELTEAQRAERATRFRVKAFLSVPYILSILTEDMDGAGVEMLKTMNFVSTGGAPLETKIGDAMVARGVRLVSRLGSSECGFLLSSHRDYATEKDWELLRNDSLYADALIFEPQENGQEGACEMVVTDRWLSKTKSNRPDGSYATGDLYTPHSAKPNVWRYIGRGDDVVVMSNGEKASPGPIETAFRSSPLFSDALVVGSDRPQLGLILFLRETTSTAESDGVRDTIARVLGEVNSSSPSFAQITQDMCKVVSDADRAAALPKSSKGTIQRGVAYEVFEREIKELYSEGANGDVDQGNIPRRTVGEITDAVRRLVREVGQGKCKLQELEDETDLFGWGVDSLMATRLRARISKELYTGTSTLPVNVVFEQPTIEKLSRHIHDLQEDKSSTDHTAANRQLMLDLASRYGTFSEASQRALAEPSSSSSQSGGKTILLTGATGSLGSFILARLASLPAGIIRRVICLVRADDDSQARFRVEQACVQRRLSISATIYSAYASTTDAMNLGLDRGVYEELSDSIDVVIHAAWPVHFASSLSSFENSIKGARNLLDLIACSRNPDATFFFCSSLASVLGKQDHPDNTALEEPTLDPSTASNIGYSQSKWVTERICHAATTSAGPLSGRVSVLRVGQLCGDTQTGYWNEKEGWPLMIRTAQSTGSLPLLDEEPSWLPVDLAANTIVDIVLGDMVPQFIYHVVHPLTISWQTVVAGLRAAQVPFEAVEASHWLPKVDALEPEDPSRQMLPLWSTAYGKTPGTELTPRPTVSTINAQAASETLQLITPLTEADVAHMVVAWRRTGFLR